MVWANSDQLGCAKKHCIGLIKGWPEPQYIMACQYKPAYVASLRLLFEPEFQLIESLYLLF